MLYVCLGTLLLLCLLWPSFQHPFSWRAGGGDEDSIYILKSEGEERESERERECVCVLVRRQLNMHMLVAQ